jgi:hypothetical protein
MIARFRYCGVFTGIRQLEMGKLKRFTFHTNGEKSDVGYSIYIRQVECETEEDVPGRTPIPTLSTYGPPIRTTTTFR